MRLNVVVLVGHIVRGEGHTGEGGEIGWVVALPLYNMSDN